MEKKLNSKKIIILKKLLEKYSKKKVFLKEFDGDEFFSNSVIDSEQDAKESNKPFQLYYLTSNKGIKNRDWLGGFDDIEHAKNYARKSYINIEKQKARREERKVNRNPKITEQGIPQGYVIEEN